MNQSIFIETIKKYSLFLIVFLINILALSPLIIFSHIHYSIDTYGILLNGYTEHMNAFIGSYRYFGAFVYWIISIMGHNPIIYPLLHWHKPADEPPAPSYF